MNTEYELTVLEINKKELEDKLISLGANKIGDFFQKRYVYDFNPVIPNKWIRLRTNGIKSTLTIKSIEDKSIIGGTKELEIEVSDFEKTNLILNELGYNHKSYQENKRTTYKLNDIEFDIDSWPLIPTYVEIEGKDEKSVSEALKLLDLKDKKVTTKDVQSIYLDFYNIDINKLSKLHLEEDR